MVPRHITYKNIYEKNVKVHLRFQQWRIINYLSFPTANHICSYHLDEFQRPNPMDPQRVRIHAAGGGSAPPDPPGEIIFVPIIWTSFNGPTPQVTISGPRTRFSYGFSLIYVISDIYENVVKFNDFQRFRPKK